MMFTERKKESFIYFRKLQYYIFLNPKAYHLVATRKSVISVNEDERFDSETSK